MRIEIGRTRRSCLGAVDVSVVWAENVTFALDVT